MELIVCPVCDTPAEFGGRICRTCFHSLVGQEPAPEHASAVMAGRTALARRRRRRRAILTVALGALVLAAGVWVTRGLWTPPPPPIPPGIGSRVTSAAGVAWPLPSGGIDGARATVAPATLTGAVSWRWDGAQTVAVPVVADGSTLFVGLTDGRLVALSADDGTERWSLRVPGVLDAAPSVAGDRLFVGLRSGEVVALDARSGTELWRSDVDRSVSATPIVSEGRVVVAANGLMLALDAEDGRELWRDSIDDSLMTVTPALDGGRLAVATFDRVLLFDARNGAQRSWFRFAPQQAPSLSVAVVQGTVVASSSGLVAAIDSGMTRPWWDGIRPAWQIFHVMGAAPAPPWNPELWSANAPRDAYPVAVGDGRVIVAGAYGTVRAYALRSGTLLWELRLPPITAPPVLVAGGVLLAGRNSITVIATADGAELTRRTFDGLTPTQVVVTESGVFVVDNGGRIAALR